MPATRFFPSPIAVACALAVLQAFTASAQTAPAAAASTVPVGSLATVTVEASADASADGLTAPFAGGQVARGGRIGILGNQDVMDSSFSSTSYTSQFIRDMQAQSVSDVLLNDPTVRTARGFGNFQELYVIRGFPVYSDDIGYNGLYGMLPRQYIASELFERVEVFRGASAFLNGAAPGGSGLGGAINLLPKRASNEPLTRLNLGVQSGGEVSGSADISRRFGPDDSTGIRVNAVKRSGNDGIDDEKRDLTAGVPKKNGLILGEAALANVGDERAECFGSIGVVEEQCFGLRSELLRLARLLRRHAVALADALIVDLDLAVKHMKPIDPLDDSPNVRRDRLGGVVGTDADDARFQPMERGSGDETRLRAARRTGMHDDVGHHVLLDELAHRGDEPQRADRRRRAEGNEKRNATLFAKPREHLLGGLRARVA